ncbi:S-adenosylmethionine-dependent methyltransferase [Melia azedarach]|uniref:S-adenosylmethionine-dependent methyltransferase n=1 Tax=Melia azedarach TaxID=155640 RepID=A0ACC1X785_MELAZ|nr:S-adenosylmethionine-dependent methyltransferase [Melia azedarach]
MTVIAKQKILPECKKNAAGAPVLLPWLIKGCLLAHKDLPKILHFDKAYDDGIFNPFWRMQMERKFFNFHGLPFSTMLTVISSFLSRLGRAAIEDLIDVKNSSPFHYKLRFSDASECEQEKMAKEETYILPKSYPMVGGDGPYSYAKNSVFQKTIVDCAKEMVTEGIVEKLDLQSLGFKNSCTFRIADLGCSVGPNTFIAVQNIIEAVEQKYQAENKNPSTMEFQVFFNDLDINDFNTLFKTLPPDREYFAAGVPGSFRNRLFPKSSLHIVHCSTTLHWLSKIPDEIVDSKSPAWNKGSIHCNGFAKEVVEAYSAQFKNDMNSFFNARAKELVPGGLMLILISTVPDGVPASNTFEGMHYDFLGSCLYDMAKMGLISEEKLDSFNLSLYFPFYGEFEALIRRNENFTIERMDKFTNPTRKMVSSAEFYSSHMRAGFEGLVKEHFGDQFVEPIFNYYSTKLEENIGSILDAEIHDKIELLVLLKRNTN